MQAPAGAAAGTLEDPPAVRGGLALHSTLGRQVRRAAPMPALPGHGAPRSARCVPRRAPAPQSRAARASARQSESASRSRSERHAGSPEAAPGAGACSATVAEAQPAFSRFLLSSIPVLPMHTGRRRSAPVLALR
jgi:hypothetical protein